MICIHCGTDIIAKDAKFCHGCGQATVLGPIKHAASESHGTSVSGGLIGGNVATEGGAFIGRDSMKTLVLHLKEPGTYIIHLSGIVILGFIAVGLIWVMLKFSQGIEASAYKKVEAYTLIKGDSINLVSITERAAERIGVQVSQVQEREIDGLQRLVVPYGAIIYGTDGTTWVYVNPEPLTYARVEVTVDFIEGDIAVLSSGPEPGTPIAMTAVAELYGIDTGVGK